MRRIIKNIYHVGDNECSVYMVDTRSDQGLVLIDAGMNPDMIRQVSSHPYARSHAWLDICSSRIGR